MSARIRRGPVVLWTVCSLLVALAVVLVVVDLTPAGSAAAHAPADPGTGLSAADAGLLSAVAVADGDRPGFALTDQRGHRVALDDLRGRAVVLTFDDDECTDICTLYAQDVLAASRDLGADRSRVAFVSVNANPYHPAVADVRAWTDEHGLGATAGWYSLTGSPTELAAVAKAWGESVRLDAADRTIEHGTDIAFLDPSGRERIAGMYGTASADTAYFGHALADAAVSLLPASERRPVAGTSGPVDATGALTSRPGAFSLAALGHPGDRVATSSKQVTVLVFFSSTCAVCASELPGIEQEHRARGSDFAFLGVDVADQDAAAQRLVRATGLRFPVGVDPSGATAARFGIADLPSTVLLAPDGTVLTSHPGLLTADQLDYLLQVLPG